MEQLIPKTQILCVVGTRPEAIKMAPVVLQLKQEVWCEVKILATAQHREMLDQVLAFFGLAPDFDLNIMKPNQSLSELTGRLMLALDEIIVSERPDVVLVQGDTTTVMTVALACFYRQVPVGHVEAGLRTWDMHYPFPEEANRVITGKLARWHFAPTLGSRANLLRDGIPDAQIYVTGNTVIDALLMTASKEIAIGVPMDTNKRLVLVTSHRRENFGSPFQNICRALSDLANRNPDIQILFPVHPNPNIKEVAYRMLGAVPNITLCSPLDYAPFIAAMKKAYMIISDSGGVQEEAPALGKPTLVLRDETERPEAVELGVVKLVGTDYGQILREAQILLDDADVYASMAKGKSPYGDGQAAERITGILKRSFGHTD
jgi:UDP-N-acetylglucosamine 2-epimerase (non-hydrolysing)